MIALDPEKNDACEVLGCEQGDQIDVKRVTERIKRITS